MAAHNRRHGQQTRFRPGFADSAEIETIFDLPDFDEGRR
jgi:hypothetical protein